MAEPRGVERDGAGANSSLAEHAGASSAVGSSPNSSAALNEPLMAGQPRPYFGDAFYSFQNVYWPIHCVICLVICTLGIFANVTNIIVLTRPNMITAVNAILSAMAFSDLIVNISNIPYLMHELSDQSNATSHFSFQWALYILFHAHTTVTAHTISIWLTCVLATWRYFVVCQRNWSVGLAKRTIAAVCFLVPVFCIPNYLSFAIVKEVIEVSRVDEPAHKSNQTYKVNETIYKVGFSDLADESKFIKTFHFWIFSCLTKLVPCVLLTFFTTVLIRKLLSARERRLRLATFGLSSGKDNLDAQLGGPPTGKGAFAGEEARSGPVKAQLAADQPTVSSSYSSASQATTPVLGGRTNGGLARNGSRADNSAVGVQNVDTKEAALSRVERTPTAGAQLPPRRPPPSASSESPVAGTIEWRNSCARPANVAGRQGADRVGGLCFAHDRGARTTSGLTLDPKELEGSGPGASLGSRAPAAGDSTVAAVSVESPAHLEAASRAHLAAMETSAEPASWLRSQSAANGTDFEAACLEAGLADVRVRATSPPPIAAGGSSALAARDARRRPDSTLDGASSNFAGSANVTILSQLIVESSGLSAGSGASTTSVAPTKMVGLAADDSESRHWRPQQKQYHVIPPPSQSGSLTDQVLQSSTPPTLEALERHRTGAAVVGASSVRRVHGNNDNDRPCNDRHVSCGHPGDVPPKSSGSPEPSTGSPEGRPSQDGRIGALSTSAARKRPSAVDTSATRNINFSPANTTNGRESLASNTPVAGPKLPHRAASSAEAEMRKRSSEAMLAGALNAGRGRSQGSGTLAPMQLIKTQPAQRQLNQNETTTRLLIAVMIVFLICEFPAGILAALCAILGQEFFENVYQPTGTLTDLLALINSSVNFILYCFMSTQFRVTFYRVVLHCPAPSMQQSSGTKKNQHIHHNLGLQQHNDQQQKQISHAIATQTTDMNSTDHDAGQKD